jgi:hypothetical protein
MDNITTTTHGLTVPDAVTSFTGLISGAVHLK